MLRGEPMEQRGCGALRIVAVGENHDEGRFVWVLHTVALDQLNTFQSVAYRAVLTRLRIPHAALEMTALDADLLLNRVNEFVG